MLYIQAKFSLNKLSSKSVLNKYSKIMENLRIHSKINDRPQPRGLRGGRGNERHNFGVSPSLPEVYFIVREGEGKLKRVRGGGKDFDKFVCYMLRRGEGGIW